MYCSNACRHHDYERLYPRAEEVTKICEECGGSFTTARGKNQKFCTPECRKRNQKKQRDTAIARKYAETLTTYGEKYQVLEADGFKCTACGRSPKDVVLDVEMGKDGKLHTMCVECRTGKDLITRQVRSR